MKNTAFKLHTFPAIPIDMIGAMRLRRAVFLKWLRKMHGWIGLWGAMLGLLFGGTGILLNHRNVMKIPAIQTQTNSVQLPLPTPAPADAQAMAAWLQQSLALEQPATSIKTEPARPVQWGDKSLTQPARWNASFSTASHGVQAEYWIGNKIGRASCRERVCQYV